MSFLSNMNFPRSVILISVIGSVVMGYLAFKKEAEVEQWASYVTRSADEVRSIQSNSKLLTSLQKRAAKEQLGGRRDLESYARRTTTHPDVEIGQVNTTPSEDHPIKGILDKHVTVRPSDRERPYTRFQIANMLFKFEADSRLVRVTRVKIEPIDRHKPHELGNDRWTFEVRITSRQAEEG